jgi:two-component system nitrate/nitrite response regulator NarL
VQCKMGDRDGARGGLQMSAGVRGLGSVLVVDDDADSRSLIADALEQGGYETREVSSGQAALEAARREIPRLVVLEVALPGLCGYEVCHRLRNEFGQGLPIIFVSAERTERFDVVAGLLLGADDYLAKPVSPDVLLARTRRLDRRVTPVTPGVAAKLTKREMEVLRLLAEGLEQEAIARELFISRKTVGTHVEHILRKLGVHSRAQAVALAYRDELVGASS